MIENPQGEIKLPTEVAKEVAKVRKQIIITEAEVFNLKKTRAGEEVVIATLVNQKGEIEQKISLLQDNVASQKVKLTALEKESSKIMQANAKLVGLNASIENDLIKKREDLKVVDESLTKEKEELRIERNRLQEKESEISIKGLRVNTFIADVNKVIKNYGD